MIYYSCFVVLFQFGWAGTQISHLALIPDLTSNTQQYLHQIRDEFLFRFCGPENHLDISEVRLHCDLQYPCLPHHLGLPGVGEWESGYRAWRCRQVQVTGEYKICNVKTSALSRNIMLVGMGLGSIATFGFHALVKEPSEEETIDLFKLSSIEVIAINCCSSSNSCYQESKPAVV